VGSKNVTKRTSASVVAPSASSVRLSSLRASHILMMINQITDAQSRVVRNRSVNSAVNLKISVLIVSTSFESLISQQSLTSIYRLYPALSGRVMLSGFYTFNRVLQLA
jgi:hypothetical protein